MKNTNIIFYNRTIYRGELTVIIMTGIESFKFVWRRSPMIKIIYLIMGLFVSILI